MPSNYLAVDVGTKRIGVAAGDSQTGIAFPLTTVTVDGQELQHIADAAAERNVTTIVVGYPRNQAGEPTEQTQVAVDFAERLRRAGLECVYQDESLTSVLAEDRLKAHKRPYEKAEVDMMAASLILQDYLEELRHA